MRHENLYKLVEGKSSILQNDILLVLKHSIHPNIIKELFSRIFSIVCLQTNLVLQRFKAQF